MHTFGHRRTIVALLISTLAGQAGAAAGRVDFAAGEVSVSGRDGPSRPLVRGAELDSGDTVRTGEGRAQIRFTDGSYVSLQPNTEFAIKEYRFDGKTDGSESGFFALAKGAMRTVTGLIGRIHRSRYQITTPTATIGIRGTGGVIQVLNDGSTLIVGTSGIWSLSNSVGSIDVPAGISAVAPAAPGSPPQPTTQSPQAGPPPVVQTTFVQGDQRTPTGAPVVGTPPLVSGSGYAFDIAQNQYGATVSSSSDAFVDFDAAGRMTAAKGAFGFPAFALEAGGSHADFGTDGILAWGRWVGPVMLQTDGTAVVDYGFNEGLHYVVGMPTPVLPATGTATYALIGATRPTYTDASTAPGTFSGSMSVTFGAQAIINGKFNVAMPDGSYALTSTGTTTTADFSLATRVTGAGNACLASCSASVQGFFAGANAERAGVGYAISDTAGKAVLGAAAFAKQ